MSSKWELKQRDRATFAAELEGFVPEKVYDSHAHLYCADWWKTPPAEVAAGPAEITLEVYREHMAWILPGSEIHGMHFPYPFPADANENLNPANEWVAHEISKDPLARGQLLVRPTDDPEWVREQVKRLGFRGLKPFAYYSGVSDIYQAEIPQYFSEPLAAVADSEGWTVTLHIMRSKGVADSSNQRWIRHYCENYPNMQLILDHCARGFNPYHVLDGLQALTGLENLWFDTSAVCNSLAVETVGRMIGPHRMLYGSDFYVSHIRGTNFSVGDSFRWVDANTDFGELEYSSQTQLPLLGIENLRAIKAAFWSLGLSDTQIEDFFWGNAAQLLDLPQNIPS